ncbi:Ribosome biogenesis protein ENP2 [Zalerion maritima]|uniref:Ribosome biogenesis protein ENP2 n=1 Tax=Zalerion maritima TaxID=339359 RepID=A0AAD5RXY9_9PEZI|nr:Ribosome biogenesis protein ENP2 [Zalerion maritima]
MKLTNDSDVAVYTISGASTARPLPDWLTRRRKRSLKDDPEFAHRVELLQDFEFEEASTAIRVSEDGNWVMSTGTYKPQIHVHDLPQLSLAFARHTPSLNVTFQLLSEDYSKSLHLQADRKLEFHTPMGCHFELRLPRYGRDLQYNRHAAEAIVPAVGLNADGNGEVFRLSLEEGRFMSSYHVDVGKDDGIEGGRQGSIHVGSVNCASIAETTHNLLAFGTSKGTVEFWDSRARARVAALGGLDGQVTALDFAPSGLSIVAGMSTGMMQLFDLRRPAPILTRNQGIGEPVQKMIHMTTASGEKKILSTDARFIKIWDELTGDPWASIESIVDLHDVVWCKQTGMLLTANEGQQQHSFFIPQLGPAPKWCSFLDNMVEEMAEEHNAESYDNYKFLTVRELKDLSLDHLIGKSNLLRPYMHGFFVADKLYEQARLIHNPYIYEEDRRKKVQERLEKQRASRIRGAKKIKASQNQKLANRLAENRKVESGLTDSRFGTIFKDDRFVVDEQSDTFKELFANARRNLPDKDLANGEDSEHEVSIQGGGIRVGEDIDLDGEMNDGNAQTNENDGVVMQVSSTGHRREKNDNSFSMRVKKSAKVRKEKQGDILGDREISFVPEKKSRRGESEKVLKTEPQKRKSDNRRSASGNVLRRQ